MYSFTKVVSLSLCLLIGVEQRTAWAQEDNNKESILNVLHTNSESFKTENVKQMLSTISPKCPSYEPTKKLMSNLFNDYDLEVTVLKREVLSINQDEAEVEELIRVKKKAGAKPFQNNETLTKSQLIYDEGAWKLCSTSILDIKYIKSESLTSQSIQTGSIAAKTSQAIMRVLQRNSDSFKTENIEQMLSTISQKCPAYAPTKKMMTDLFKAYDLEVSVLTREILTVHQDKAEVKELIRVKKKVGVQAFQDNETLTKSTLIHDETGWKLCSTEILNVKYLNAQK